MPTRRSALDVKLQWHDASRANTGGSADPSHRRLGSAMRHAEPPLGVAVGDVLFLHESVTRFSRKDRMRWCVVTAVVGRNVRVAGRSTTRTDGVPVPASVMPEFTADGWFPRPPIRIALADARGARRIGCLPDPYLAQVLFHMNEEMP
jgi:hypothetical protein